MTFMKGLAFLAVFSLLVIYAYGQEVHYNYDRSANFGLYKTYRWVNLEGAVPDDLVDQAIKRAIDEQLAQKGLTKVEKDADLYIGYQAVILLEKGVNLFGTRDGFGGGAGGWSSASVQGQTSTIPVGTLVVDVYDREKKQLVWRGDATKTIDLHKDPDKNYKNLQKAMTKLFKNYPPQSGK